MDLQSKMPEDKPVLLPLNGKGDPSTTHSNPESTSKRKLRTGP